MEAKYCSRMDQEKELSEAWFDNNKKGSRWPSLGPAKEPRRVWGAFQAP